MTSQNRHAAVGAILPQRFYAREALELAGALLGMFVVRGEVVLRITEVEAYRHPGDSANHCRMGRTARNAPMWGAAGHAYIYLCYGVHPMLNIVSDGPDQGAAVLIRACEPVAGLDTIRSRRGGRQGPALLTGPGKVGRALDLTVVQSGEALFRGGGLLLRRGSPPSAILVGPRVGIGYASKRDQRAPWRLAAADTEWVSQRRSLRARRSP